MVGFNFAPTGWAFCNGQTMRYCTKRGPLFAFRDNLRRQRHDHVQPSQFARSRSDTHGAVHHRLDVG